MSKEEMLPNVEAKKLARELNVKGVEKIDVVRPEASPIPLHSHHHPPIDHPIDDNYKRC